jgi:glycopeptide antibiotics resistance protein
MPLGYFFKELFHASLKKAVLAGFLISMLYELTQLTGLFFLYPRPYRIFDIDDLIINTLGAYCGYILAPLLPRFLIAIAKGSVYANVMPPVIRAIRKTLNISIKKTA